MKNNLCMLDTRFTLSKALQTKHKRGHANVDYHYKLQLQSDRKRIKPAFDHLL